MWVNWSRCVKLVDYTFTYCSWSPPRWTGRSWSCRCSLPGSRSRRCAAPRREASAAPSRSAPDSGSYRWTPLWDESGGHERPDMFMVQGQIFTIKHIFLCLCSSASEVKALIYSCCPTLAARFTCDGCSYPRWGRTAERERLLPASGSSWNERGDPAGPWSPSAPTSAPANQRETIGYHQYSKSSPCTYSLHFVLWTLAHFILKHSAALFILYVKTTK